MKKIIFNFSFIFGKTLSFFLFRLLKKMGYIFDYFYSGWISKQFKNIGLEPVIAYPISLIGGEFIKIGNNFTCGKRLRLNAYNRFMNENYNPEVILGDNININDDCHIACVEKIQIGNNVLIAGKVFISDHLHGNTEFESLKIPPSSRHLITKGGVLIEDDVWIGENVAILPGVKIGKGVIIGANSVVTKSIPAYSILVGVPAKCIKIYT